MKNKDNYHVYTSYKYVIDLLTENQYNILELVEKTNMPISTVYRIVNSLVKNDILKIAKYSGHENHGRNAMVFGIKK